MAKRRNKKRLQLPWGCSALIQRETGLSQPTIRAYLRAEYEEWDKSFKKQEEFRSMVYERFGRRAVEGLR